jgi:hypothetical protein
VCEICREANLITCYHDNVIMLSWQLCHVITTVLPGYHANVIMLSWQPKSCFSWLRCHVIMAIVSCYYDNMLSYFSLKT